MKFVGGAGGSTVEEGKIKLVNLKVSELISVEVHAVV